MTILIQKIRSEFEPKGIKVFPISAVSGQGVNELLYYVHELLSQINEPPIIFESEYNPDTDIVVGSEPYTVEYDEKKNEYVVEGPRIEKCLDTPILNQNVDLDFSVISKG